MPLRPQNDLQFGNLCFSLCYRISNFLQALVYDEDLFPDDSPSLIDGSGDGTVNVWSSSFCLRWKGQQKAAVSGLDMPGNDHVKILWNVTLHSYLGTVLVT